jgi:nitric oxide reductase NorD protein
MEEWVGQWWHRAITRLADNTFPDAAVTLEEASRAVGLLFRAAGGAAAVRLAPASAARHSGPRGWLQRVAGGGERTHRARLDPDTLALPPVLAVFADRALNHDLYLWLAALAALHEPTGDWIADNRAATARALQHFSGLRARHRRLVDTHLAQRPRLDRLRGGAALWEAAVQAALRGEDHTPLLVAPDQVSPVWLWVEAGDAAAGMAGSATSRRAGQDAGARITSTTRRRARQVGTPDERRAMLLPSRNESLKGWSEFVRMDRASDDESDPAATAAADDMETLALVRGGRQTAARVRFDLDLPSAAADDAPLGPGRETPEWDWRRRQLLPDHCAVQCVVARPGAPYRPAPALQATARRVRRRLEVLRAAPRWQTGMTQGDAIDMDAWVRFSAEVRTGSPQTDSPPVYARRIRGERSLATLLLADLSLSTDAHANTEARVIDVIRDALYVFGEALAGTGDAFEMLGFCSVRRQHVRIQHLKGFDERWNDTVRARVGAIRPGYYTRMGAAVREATRRLGERPERQRLLLVLTDGKPHDLDVYDGRYGLEDTRHAVQAAREAGLTPFCVTIDSQAHDYLPMLFGQRGYALVRRPEELVRQLTQAWVTLAR